MSKETEAFLRLERERERTKVRERERERVPHEWMPLTDE